MDRERARRFYRERIPAQFDRNLDAERAASGADSALVRSMEDVRVSLSISLVAAGETESFELEVDGGRMRPVEAPRHPRLLALHHDWECFEVLERESGDSILGFVAGVAGLAGELQLTRARAAQLRSIEASIALERVGREPFSLVAHFGEGSLRVTEPDCLLRMTHEVHDELRSGRLDVQDAFLTEQVRVEGDMQKALDLALCVIDSD